MKKLIFLLVLFLFTKILIVQAQPTITSFSPTSGPVGTSVTITGINFNAVPANNIVYFGAVRATVTSGTTTSLTVTAPAGATYQPISVLNNATGLTGYSSKPFIITFTNPFGTGIPANFYKPKVDFTTGSNPNSVAIGDVDGDGKPDLVVANSASASVSVFRNTSSSGNISPASFAAKVDFTSGPSPYSVAIGDVDGDGKPDLVIGNGTNTISVLQNTSTSGSISASSFAAKVDFITVSYTKSVAIGDVDGDGKPDLVAANTISYLVSVFRNTSITGSINASSFAAKVDFVTGSYPSSVAIRDVDGDGKPDLVTANIVDNTISVLRNTSTSGSISASSFAAKVDFATGVYPYSVAIGDVDGDGKPDLVAANNLSNSVSVFRNISTSGNISPSSFAAKVDFTVGSGPYSVVIGDVDGDGKPDLVIANSGNNTISVLRNTSTSGSISVSSFAAKVDFVTGAYPYSVAIGDLDGDGIPEIAAANSNSNTVSVFQIAQAVYTFTGNGDWDIPSNWVNNLVAPKNIPGGATVIIDHVPSGQCRDTGNISIQLNGILTVQPNKILNIENGDLSNAGTLNGTGIVNFSGGPPAALSSSGLLTTPITIANKQMHLSGNTTTSTITLSNGGTIRLDKFNLNMGSANLVGGNSSNFIITNDSGILKRYVISTSLLYPIGVSLSSYTPVTVSNAGTGDTFSVRVAQGVLTTGRTFGTPITSGTVNRTWFISEAVQGGSNANISVQWNLADEQTGFNRTSSYISHYIVCPPPIGCVGGFYDAIAPTAASGSGPFSQSRNNVTNFNSPSFIVSSLPDLYSFTNATGNGDWNNTLNWTNGRVPSRIGSETIISDGMEVTINPSSGDCNYTGIITMQPGGKLTVMAGKNLNVKPN